MTTTEPLPPCRAYNLDYFGSPQADPVCDFSYLRESQCAHCLGHRLDPELEEVSER